MMSGSVVYAHGFTYAATLPVPPQWGHSFGGWKSSTSDLFCNAAPSVRKCSIPRPRLRPSLVCLSYTLSGITGGVVLAVSVATLISYGVGGLKVCVRSQIAALSAARNFGARQHSIIALL